MKKIGIIVDSASGLTKKEAQKRGWGFIPLHFTINGKEYADGIDLSPEEYYDMIDIKMSVSTAAASTEEILQVYRKMSKEYENVIVYTISLGLSANGKNAMVLAKDFANVHVVDSKSVSYGIISDCEQIEMMDKSGMGIKEIVKKSNELTDMTYGLVIPETMDWLKKGGRVSPTLAAMAGLLKIVPIIALENGKLEKHGKSRSFKKTVGKIAREMKKVMDSRENSKIFVLHADNKEIDEHMKEIHKIFGTKDIVVSLLPPIIATHTGPGTIGLISVAQKG